MDLQKLFGFGSAGLLAVTLAGPALADSDHSLGKTLHEDGLVIHPVYIQPVTMAPAMPGMSGSKADAHLEIDIHADKNNKQGFPEGAWVPYLTVSYRLEKQDADWATTGTLMPMVADDGSHYGENVRLDGPGKYTATFKIEDRKSVV